MARLARLGQEALRLHGLMSSEQSSVVTSFG
jgi:hypothetical protein